jgi:hypothetical protein
MDKDNFVKTSSNLKNIKYSNCNNQIKENEYINKISQPFIQYSMSELLKYRIAKTK